MRARHWLAPLALAALTSAGAALAEPIGPHWEFTPFAGYTLFDAKLRFPGSTNPVADNLLVGGRIGYQSRSWVGLEGAVDFTPTTEDVSGGRDFDWLHASGNFVLSPARGRWANPFVFAGFGWTQLKPAAGDKVTTGTIEFGAGEQWWLTDDVGLRFEARDVSFKPLQNVGGQTNYNNVGVGVGLTWALGAIPRDTDGDGVPDKRDKCPGTPRGATVDAAGCPHDTDGDGVLDGLDKCPGTPKGATVDSVGCPHDQDGDGVYDGIDKCPDTPKGATVDATGCPHDSDGDGVLDGLDQCPNTPAGAKVDDKGCPIDSDGDGVPDGIDQCPNTPTGAKVDANGCPIDSDGDGVPDGLDKCPNTPAGVKVDVDGCPIQVTERETEFLDTGLLRLEGVNFETGKADLLPEDFGKLDEVGALLAKWPQLKVEIGGHTDSRGTVAKNQTLSEARAKSVQAYLLQKFPAINPDNLSAKGYGKSKPVVPNTNPDNMAKNRRVEFKVLNKDVLKNVREQVKTLQK